MQILKLQAKFRSRLFGCKFHKELTGAKLEKMCNRCTYKGDSICPLQRQGQENVVSLDQFRKPTTVAAATN